MLCHDYMYPPKFAVTLLYCGNGDIRSEHAWGIHFHPLRIGSVYKD